MQRMCVGCGSRAEKRAMHRVVRDAGALALDMEQRRPGRGAYVHREQACIAAFAQRRGGLRSLRWSPPASERTRIAAALQGLDPSGVR